MLSILTSIGVALLMIVTALGQLIIKLVGFPIKLIKNLIKKGV